MSLSAGSTFGRVLVGIDDSPESLEAARQAAILATGPVTLLAAYDLTQTIVRGGMAPAPVAPLDEGLARTSRPARSAAGAPGRCSSTRSPSSTSRSSPSAPTARAVPGAS
jgi:nucleotide-binding universal stress UspA family protein